MKIVRFPLLALGMVFSFLLCSPAGFSQTPLPGVLKADYQLLFLMHPLMADFDVTLGRHIRPGVNLNEEKNRNALEKEMESRNQQAKQTVDELQKKIDALLVELQNEGKRVKIAIEAPPGTAPIDISRSQKKAKAPENDGKNDAKKDSDKTTASAKKPDASLQPWMAALQKKAEIRKNIRQLKNEQELALESVYDPMYLPRAESLAVQKKALAEIDEILAAVSQKQGNALVIDSNYIRTPEIQRNFHPSTIMCLDLLNVGMRQQILEFKNQFETDMHSRYQQADMQSFFQKTILTDEAKKKLFEDNMNQWTNFDFSLSTALSKYPGVAAALNTQGRFFLVGGDSADITKQVLTELYKKHSVREEISQRIFEKLFPR